MLSMEDYIVIKALNQHGAYLKDIAAELGVHPKTIPTEEGEEGRAYVNLVSGLLKPVFDTLGSQLPLTV